MHVRILLGRRTHVHARVQPRCGGKSARNWWDSGRTRLVLNSKILQIMSGRGRGVSGTPFRGSRLPLAPRTNTGPYARPNGPTRLPPSQPGNGRLPDTGNSRSGNDRFHHQTRTNTDGSDQVSGPTLGEILDEVRRGREDQTKIRDDLKRINQLIAKLEEEYRKLNEQFKQQTDASFSVDTSVYKVIYSTIKLLTHDIFIIYDNYNYKDDLLKEAGMLFAKSLRQPSRQDIGV